jgi:hypothetical protein
MLRSRTNEANLLDRRPADAVRVGAGRRRPFRLLREEEGLPLTRLRRELRRAGGVLPELRGPGGLLRVAELLRPGAVL